MGTKLLNNVEATGASSGKLKVPSGKTHHTVSMVYDSTGSVTAMTIDLEGSIDNGTTWHQLASHACSAGELSALQAMIHVADKPVDWVRVNVTTLTESGTTNVDVWYL